MFFLCLHALITFGQGKKSPTALPSTVRGFCIGAPSYKQLDRFVSFIDTELAPRKVNVLILRVDYNYRYTSHPELISTAKRQEDSTQSVALTRVELKKIVDACKRNGILLVPQVNLLGHQSGGTKVNPLLINYPQFDETPWINMPTEYKWPNPDKLYCKSYCPLHPDVHKVVFDLVDEIMTVCETKHFHAGMDEVFYLGEDKCPRCAGKDRSELFANEVNKIAAHVEAKGGRLWIWGDRMLDSKMTRLGMWEASENDTQRSMDLINRNVVINDWHYDSPALTPLSFAVKGYDVMICPWNKAEVTRLQVADYQAFQKAMQPAIAKKYKGIIQTIWTSAEHFMDTFYGVKPEEGRSTGTVESFKTLFTLF